MKPQDIEKIYTKFVSDPDWVLVEELLLNYMKPLTETENIDTSMPAEHVKAELIARNLLKSAVDKFLDQTKIIQHRGIKPTVNPFK
jgi:hypothetical protein